MSCMIDGDLFVYRAAAATETPIDWGDDWWTIHCDIREAENAWDQLMKPIINRRFGEMVVAFSDSENYRKGIYPGYKNGRPRKPVGYAALKARITARYKTFCYPQLEGDDVMGIHATQFVMVSEDKDMRGVPGKLYNPATDTLLKTSKQEADAFFFRQALMGDSTDGYPGCPGIGEKRADDILKGLTTPAEMWEAVLKAYSSKELTEEEALIQARCARILRPKEYNIKTGEIQLWNPSTLTKRPLSPSPS